jgi:hypothetical protein
MFRHSSFRSTLELYVVAFYHSTYREESCLTTIRRGFLHRFRSQKSAAPAEADNGAFHSLIIVQMIRDYQDT